jgi:hypothetical protein
MLAIITTFSKKWPENSSPKVRDRMHLPLKTYFCRHEFGTKGIYSNGTNSQINYKNSTSTIPEWRRIGTIFVIYFGIGTIFVIYFGFGTIWVISPRNNEEMLNHWKLIINPARQPDAD